MHNELTDGLIVLRPLTLQDAAAHLAGEDEAIAMWLSGGQSTAATVEKYIESSATDWRADGPRRAFGIFDRLTGLLIGSVEALLYAPYLEVGQVNVSYGVFAPWRGKGIAVRALRLMCSYLKTWTNAEQVVLRTSANNQASIRVANKAGFERTQASESDGLLIRYVHKLT